MWVSWLEIKEKIQSHPDDMKNLQFYVTSYWENKYSFISLEIKWMVECLLFCMSKNNFSNQLL